jgi:cytochrome b561
VAMRAESEHYDRPTIFFHWTTAVLVAIQWTGAQTIDWFPSGAIRVDVRSMHITVGVVLAVILVARIIWRLILGRRLPPAEHGILYVAAKAAHWGLYALLLAMVLVGIVLTWVRGDNIFNFFSIPAFDPGNRDLPDQVQNVHATIGWIVLVVAGLHTAAALVHRYIFHDKVLARMLPDG